MQVAVCVQQSFAPDTDPLAERELLAVLEEMWNSWFQQWLEILQPDISPINAYELSLRLTDDAEIQALNNQYRQKDTPTDVLAFAALEAEALQAETLREIEPLYLGDIVISLPTAQRQAIAEGHSLQVELAWLAAHGLLHLLGWDHPNEEQLVRMLAQQTNLLHTVGLKMKSR